MPLIVLGLVSAAGAVVTSRHDYGYWTPLPAAPATPTGAPTGADACVVGTWTERSRLIDRATNNFGTLRFASHGLRQSFSVGGVLTLDYGAGYTERATTPSGQVVEYRVSGQITYRYAIGDGLITYRAPTATGSVSLLVDARVVATGPLVGDTAPDHFRCSGDSLVEYGDTYAIDLVRTPN